jgi:hypothetical protein
MKKCRQCGKQPGDGEDDYLDPIHIDAGEPGRRFVATNGIDMAPEPGPAQEK